MRYDWQMLDHARPLVRQAYRLKCTSFFCSASLVIAVFTRLWLQTLLRTGQRNRMLRCISVQRAKQHYCLCWAPTGAPCGACDNLATAVTDEEAAMLPHASSTMTSAQWRRSGCRSQCVCS